MAKVEFDPRSVTLGEIGAIYQTAQETKSKPTFNQKLFGSYMNTPVIDLFDDSNGDSVVRTLVRTAAENGTIPESTLKTLMQNLRNVNVFLRKELGREAPDFLLKTDDAKQGAAELFGFEEPAKAKADLGIDTRAPKRQEFFDELLQYGAKNPDQMPAVRAIIFGMNTGLRPGAYIVTGKDSGMRPDYYLPEDGALWIPAEATGAKGRKISVPLNAMADSMIQQQLADGTKSENIFSYKDGKPVTSSDVNKILGEVKVPRLIYDASTGKYYDNFMLDAEAKTKKGIQILRNYHTTFGLKNGVDPVVLAKLQGRSGKSSARGATGELFTYESQFPGEVSEFEREQANVFAATFQPEIQKSKTVIQNIVQPDFQFDTGDVTTDVSQTRVTSSTAGFEGYFDRPVQDALPEGEKGGPTASITTQDAPLTPAENKDFLERLMKFGTEGLKALPIVGVGIAAGAKKAEAEEMIEEGEGALPAYLQKGAEFIAEEATPYGFVPPVEAAVGAGLEAGAEALQQEAEEKGISGDIEAQLRGMFGVPQ